MPALSAFTIHCIVWTIYNFILSYVYHIIFLKSLDQHIQYKEIVIHIPASQKTCYNIPKILSDSVSFLYFIPFSFPGSSDAVCGLHPPFLGPFLLSSVWFWDLDSPLNKCFLENSWKNINIRSLRLKEKRDSKRIVYIYFTLFFCCLFSFSLSFLESSNENSTIGLYNIKQV